MLQAASNPAYAEDGPALSPLSPPATRALHPSSTAAMPDRYRPRSRFGLPAILAILLAHGLLIAAIMQVRQHVHRTKEASLTVVNLAPPPAPPPAQSAPPPPPQVVASPPLVQTPLPVRSVQTVPEPVPVETLSFTAAAAPSPAPAPTPAPVTPPAPPSVIQGGDLSTQMVSGKPPRYPVESRRKREQGTVVLSLTLGLDGAVETVALARSSGFTRLDDAARDAVKGWRWRPTVRGGQPVRVRGVVEIPFILQERG